MTKTETIFLDLLRAGLWGGEPAHDGFPLTSEEWNSLYFVAHKQTVQGIIYEAVCRLPEEFFPPIDLFHAWMLEVQRLENVHLQQLKCLNYLFTRYHVETHLQPILLKGLGLAACYPEPSRRVSGDIDLFWGSLRHAAEADSKMQEWGIPVNQGDDGESNYMLNAVVVEHHAQLFLSRNVFRRQHFSRWAQDLVAQPDATRTATIERTEVTLLNSTLDFLQLTMHSAKHLFNEGIGLRQMCDVAMFLKAHSGQIDAAQLQSHLHHLQVTHWANLTLAFAVQILGLPTESLPYTFELNRYNSEKLLAEIWKSGNFGHLDERNAARPDTKWGGKWFTAKRMMRNSLLFFRYAPGEALGPLGAAWYRVGKQFGLYR